MTEDRQEKNRILAEWLGWTFKRTGADVTLTRQSNHARYTTFGPSPQAELRLIELHAPDFYTSEDASALLLDKIASDRRFCCVELVKDNEGGVWNFQLRLASDNPEDAHLPIQPNFSWPDRKEAVAEAALAYIESLAAQEKK